MADFKIVDEQVRSLFGSWSAFCAEHGHDAKNFKRKLITNLRKIDRWLAPLQLGNALTEKQDAGCKVRNFKELEASVAKIKKVEHVHVGRCEHRAQEGKPCDFVCWVQDGVRLYDYAEPAYVRYNLREALITLSELLESGNIKTEMLRERLGTKLWNSLLLSRLRVTGTPINDVLDKNIT